MKNQFEATEFETEVRNTLFISDDLLVSEVVRNQDNAVIQISGYKADANSLHDIAVCTFDGVSALVQGAGTWWKPFWSFEILGDVRVEVVVWAADYMITKLDEPTPADVGIAGAVADTLFAEATAAQAALDADGYPTWEKIAEVHRLAAEARLVRISDLEKRIAGLVEENEALLLECKNS